MSGPVPDSVQRSLYDSLPDGIIIVDLKGRITYVNQPLAAMAGYEERELTGSMLEELVPQALRSIHRRHRQSYVAAGIPKRPMGTHLRIRLRRKDGTELPVDISLRSLVTDDGPAVLGAVRDATERTRSVGRVEALLEISQQILRGEHSEDVLRLIAQRAHQLMGAELAVIAVPTANLDELMITVAEGAAAAHLVEGTTIPLARSLPGEVIRSGRNLMIEDALADPRAAVEMAVPIRQGATIVVALKVEGSIFGTLTVANLQGGPHFADEDLRVVELFASQASVALEYSRVRDQLRRLAVVEDRERIGRELHDGVIQSLFGVGMNLQATATMIGPGDPHDRLEKAVEELDQAIRDLRNYIFGLRPGILADRQLGQVISHLAADTEERSGISVAVQVDPHLAAELSSRAGDIVQLVRESLSNVARHSGAATCRVSLIRDEGRAVLAIEDDGHGFDPERPGGGQGLGNLRDRVASLDGHLTIESGAAGGTRVEAILPI